MKSQDWFVTVRTRTGCYNCRVVMDRKHLTVCEDCNRYICEECVEDHYEFDELCGD